MHVGPGDGELTEHVNQPPPPATTLEALEPSVSSPTTSFKYDCVYICIFACEVRGGGLVVLWVNLPHASHSHISMYGLHRGNEKPALQLVAVWMRKAEGG